MAKPARATGHQHHRPINNALDAPWWRPPVHRREMRIASAVLSPDGRRVGMVCDDISVRFTAAPL